MTTTKRDFKIGIAGCGRISQDYIQAIKACPNVRLDAVVDTRAESAQSAAEASRCPAFTDIGDFATNSGVSAAIICAPPNVHGEIAQTLLSQGIHVLCEKPFAPRYDDALSMVRTASEKDLILMMASKFRYVEDIIRAKAIIASGMLGDIQFYENRFCSKVNMEGRWNSNPEIAGGGVVIDNGTHSVDIVRYLLGPIQRIHAQEGKRIAGLPVEDTSTVSFVTEGGVMGTIYLSWEIQIRRPDYINIYGTDGALSIGWQSSQYQRDGHADGVSFGVGYNKIDAFKNQVMNFVDTIRGAATPIISTEEGLASVEVIEAAYKSMKSKDWIELEVESSGPRLAIAT